MTLSCTAGACDDGTPTVLDRRIDVLPETLLTTIVGRQTFGDKNYEL